MKLEDTIQAFVVQTYIMPARRAGQSQVSMQVAEVQQAMRLESNLAEIARVLSSLEFEQYARVRLLRRRGPHMGGNLSFQFKILD